MSRLLIELRREQFRLQGSEQWERTRDIADHIEKLERLFKESCQVNGYYANKDNWSRSNRTHFCRINCNDVYLSQDPYKRAGFQYSKVEVGGARAKEFIDKKEVWDTLNL